jgi:hypothetical protein
MIRKRTKLRCSISPGSIQGIVFSIENKGILLTNPSKDNTRVELEKVERIPMC